MMALDGDPEAQHPTDLPGCEVLSLVNLNAAVPVNWGAALNVLSDGSAAWLVRTRTRRSTRACWEPRCRPGSASHLLPME
jgi:hypothetical protein